MEEAWGFEPISTDDAALVSTGRQKVDHSAEQGTEKDDLEIWGFGSTNPHSKVNETSKPDDRLTSVLWNSETSFNSFTSSLGSGREVSTKNLDSWGFEPSSIVENLLDTPLGRAVASLNVPSVERNLANGADPKIKDYKNNNLLHLMANPDLNQRSSDHIGSWNSLVSAATVIATLLLKYGVDPTVYTGVWDLGTPLLTTVRKEKTYAEGHIIVALLDAGVDANSVSSDNKESILHRWVQVNPSTLRFPESYFIVLNKIIKKMDDLGIQDRFGWSALHMLLRTPCTISYFDQVFKRLISPKHPKPVPLDITDRWNKTPLMLTLVPYGGKDYSRAKLLLEAGANTRVLLKDDKSVITPLVGGYQDVTSAEILKLLINYDSERVQNISDTKDEPKSMLETLQTKDLGLAVLWGMENTVSLLLDYGMTDRINDLVDFEIWAQSCSPHINASDENAVRTGSVLDMACCGAQFAREIFIHHLNYDAKGDIGAEEDANMYDNSSYGAAYAQGSSSQRRGGAKDAYWNFPRLLQLLVDRGFKRTKPPNMRFEPSYYDAVELPGCSNVDCSHPPHKDHWKILYDLQMLDHDWEGKALKEVIYMYRNTSTRRPYDNFGQRWPQLAGLLADDKSFAQIQEAAKMQEKIEQERYEKRRAMIEKDWAPLDTRSKLRRPAAIGH